MKAPPKMSTTMGFGEEDGEEEAVGLVMCSWERCPSRIGISMVVSWVLNCGHEL